VQAGLCRHPADYPWSSYRPAVAPAPGPPIAVDRLSWFTAARKEENEDELARYRDLVEATASRPTSRAAPPRLRAGSRRDGARR
jgi:hypothetical protein